MIGAGLMKCQFTFVHAQTCNATRGEEWLEGLIRIDDLICPMTGWPIDDWRGASLDRQIARQVGVLGGERDGQPDISCKWYDLIAEDMARI
jgi:hypothetical protein